MSRINETKNPLFWAAIAFAGGMTLAGWGWDKYESTIPARTQGSVPMMIIGGIAVVVGLIYFFTGSNKGS